ncbi:SDR family NAD(P)-dependent oxidoreductase, partial [Enterococcus faecium]|uniref:SDR family NAD(P)-dependent oxidoreductase n=1 Tax=Enterococcus faecium TaxID=1352 RepID=UPI003AAB1972
MTAHYPSLIGRTVFVTGGASGIGACLVESFVTQEAHVAFVDIDLDAAADLVERLDNAPLFLPCDIREVDTLRRAVATAGEQLGDIAVLVNNAASDDRHDWSAVTPDYWDDRMAINLRPQFFAAQA